MTTHREFCVEICDKTIAASHEVAAGQTDKEKQRKTFLKIPKYSMEFPTQCLYL